MKNCFMTFHFGFLDTKWRGCHDTSTPDYDDLDDIDITFPDAMGIQIFNWPYEEFNLRNQISSLGCHGISHPGPQPFGHTD